MTSRWLSLEPAKEGFVVLVHERDRGLTVAPGYVLTSASLHEAPALLADFPPDTVLGTSPPGEQVLRGQVSIAGSWPEQATAQLDELPNGGCAGCIESYEWRAGRWAIAAPRSVKPAWLKPAELGPTPRRVSWANGVTLWEKYDWETRDSILFVDPQGKQRAQRQRARCRAKGMGPLRIEGPLSAVALADGSLLSVGNDCETKLPTVELWPKGALESRVVPLPETPGSILERSQLTDPVQFIVHSSEAVIVAFEAQHESLTAPYLAAFDGKHWSTLGFPVEGAMRQVLLDRFGALWVLGYFGHNGVWRHPNPFVKGQAWRDVSPEGLSEPFTLVESPEGTPWLINGVELHEWKQERWSTHRLPELGSPRGPVACAASKLRFFAEGELAIVAECGAMTALLRNRTTDKVIER